MSKFGNKGFMMAEVVVVSVIVAVTLVTLYTSVNRITTAFNLRNRYHDLDCLNLSIAVNDEIIKNGEINTLLNSSSTVVDNNVSGLYNNDYERVNVYYVKNDTSLDISNINGSLNATAKEYFEYLSKHGDDKYNYYIVSEICKTGANDCFYYGLGVR